jgi:hypothetical protein
MGTPSANALKGVQHLDTGVGEVPRIASDHGQSMHQRGCREQAINSRSSLARVEPSPLFCDPPIDTDDAVREQVNYQDQLAFERRRTFRVAESQLLDSRPNLADD